jgi:cation diffusion facilitator CzcD-associated flavoprotein CzcO
VSGHDCYCHLSSRMLTRYFSALTPKYPLGCKRVAFDVGWLESLHRPNVDLVNHPIVQVTPRGLVTSDGVEKEFDVIIFATVGSRLISSSHTIADLKRNPR